MRRNRFVCLFFLAAFFVSFSIAVPQCIAKDAKAGHVDRSKKPYTRYIKPSVSGKPSPYVGYGKAVGPGAFIRPAKPGPVGPDNPYLVYPSYSDSFHPASPTIAAPFLQGVTSGTIGPPSAPAFPGVILDQSQISATQKESPVVPTLLFASLALSLMFVGIRSVVFKKRAPLFILGLIAAGALMLVGFMLSFYEPVTLAVAPRMQPSAIPGYQPTEVPTPQTSAIPISQREPGECAFESKQIKLVNKAKPVSETATSTAAFAISD